MVLPNVSMTRQVVGPAYVTKFETDGVGEIVDVLGTCTENSIKSVGIYKKKERDMSHAI